MGVYISMEMPKNCEKCFAYDWDYRWCKILWADTEPMTRDGCCPLTEIPPHGRLIDADEFLKRAIGTKCFRGDYALMLEELVGESTAIIPAEPPKEET